MKTINFELSKRLNDLGLLDNIETEWKIQLLPTKEGNKWNKGRKVKNWNGKGRIYKTLTLEEAIDFINNNSITFEIIMGLRDGYLIKFDNSKNKDGEIYINGKTLLEAIESMLEYLLDNNLLTK